MQKGLSRFLDFAELCLFHSASLPSLESIYGIICSTLRPMTIPCQYVDRIWWNIPLPWSHVHIMMSTRRKLRGFEKLKKIQKIQKEFGIWWVGPGPIWIKTNIENLSKNKVLRLYNSPLRGGARGASRYACIQHFIPYSVILW